MDVFLVVSKFYLFVGREENSEGIVREGWKTLTCEVEKYGSSIHDIVKGG